jgi:hypothetical protein
VYSQSLVPTFQITKDFRVRVWLTLRRRGRRRWIRERRAEVRELLEQVVRGPSPSLGTLLFEIIARRAATTWPVSPSPG